MFFFIQKLVHLILFIVKFYVFFKLGLSFEGF
jgi:hypothetical protein